MEKKQFDLVAAVLSKFDEHRLLDTLVLIGSWCIPLYKGFFQGIEYTTIIRTRDIDFLVPLRAKFKQDSDVAEMLKSLGFVVNYDHLSGGMKLMHPEFILEFLVPDIGRGLPDPYSIPALKVNAQPLRFLDLLLRETITVSVNNIHVRVPHPAVFAIHKLIISERRKSEDKIVKDRADAIKILHALDEIGQLKKARSIMATIPKKWGKSVVAALEDVQEHALVEKLITKK